MNEQRCPECTHPMPAGAGKYTPWCSAGCKRRAARRGAIDPDTLARRVVYMQSCEARRLRTELSGALRRAAKAEGETAQSCMARRLDQQSHLLAVARLSEEIAVLRWYGSKDCTAMADAELARRSREGRREDDVGASAVINALRHMRGGS